MRQGRFPILPSKLGTCVGWYSMDGRLWCATCQVCVYKETYSPFNTSIFGHHISNEFAKNNIRYLAQLLKSYKYTMNIWKQSWFQINDYCVSFKLTAKEPVSFAPRLVSMLLVHRILSSPCQIIELCYINCNVCFQYSIFCRSFHVGANRLPLCIVSNVHHRQTQGQSCHYKHSLYTYNFKRGSGIHSQTCANIDYHELPCHVSL